MTGVGGNDSPEEWAFRRKADNFSEVSNSIFPSAKILTAQKEALPAHGQNEEKDMGWFGCALPMMGHNTVNIRRRDLANAGTVGLPMFNAREDRVKF
jgi:hypothetical protein